MLLHLKFLPRLWATRKIGYLLNQIRLNGENPEWVQAIVDLSVRYGPAGEVTAVDGISLTADHGEVVVVLGPNGAGKTSTIESLEGYRRPSAGSWGWS